MEIQEIVQTQMEIRKLVQSQMTTLSFSRFGRNLEKTSFQTMSKQSSNPPSAKQQHLFTILPQQKLQDQQQKPTKPQTQQTTRINQQDRKNQQSNSLKPQSQQSNRSNPNDKKEIQMQVNANWLFKRVERSKGIFFKGGPSREKPIEPRYHPRYEMLYPHTPHCYIKDHSVEVSKLPKENQQERPISQSVEIRQNHINTPTPLHLQTNRQPIINKTFYMNDSFDFFVPKTSQENRSHSFNSYQAHHTINRIGDTNISSKKKVSMPEYEVFKSWNLTQATRTRGIDFGRPVNKIHPHLRQFKKKPFGQEKTKKDKLNMSELSSY